MAKKKTDELPQEIIYTSTDAILSAIGATLLIVSEMLGAIVAFAWAIGGLFGFGQTVTSGIMVVLFVPGVVLAFSLTRRILRVERHLRARG